MGCTSCCKPGDDAIVGDDIFKSNAHAINETLGLKNCRIIHVNLTNEIFRSPYLIALDRDNQSIVVAVRGTLSFSDALVDIQVGEIEIDVPQSPKDDPFIAHLGFYKTAKNIYDDIKHKGFVNQLREVCNWQLRKEIIR